MMSGPVVHRDHQSPISLPPPVILAGRQFHRMLSQLLRAPGDFTIERFRSLLMNPERPFAIHSTGVARVASTSTWRSGFACRVGRSGAELVVSAVNDHAESLVLVRDLEQAIYLVELLF
jgi:hypothetical protein